MSVRTPHPLIEPLIRTMMQMPPALVRQAPESGTKKLRTILLKESNLVRGLQAEFDDTCFLTTVDGEQDRINNVKLVLPGGKKSFSELHFTVLSLAGQIHLLLGGDQIRVFVGVGSVVRANVQLSSKPSLFIGDFTTMSQTKLIVANADLVVGSDCQFSDEVLVQCSHQHQLYDMDSQEPLTGPRSRMVIGRHVWVGRRATILPGAEIGEGAVVEGGSVVTSQVAANTLVGGAPAQVLRERISWSREFGKLPPAMA